MPEASLPGPGPVFESFLNGMRPYAIAADLNRRGEPTAQGKRRCSAKSKNAVPTGQQPAASSKSGGISTCCAGWSGARNAACG